MKSNKTATVKMAEDLGRNDPVAVNATLEQINAMSWDARQVLARELGDVALSVAERNGLNTTYQSDFIYSYAHAADTNRRAAVVDLVEAERLVTKAIDALVAAAKRFDLADEQEGSCDAAAVRSYLQQLARFQCCDRGEAGFGPFVDAIRARLHPDLPSVTK
jgi:hypothetical protein